MENIRYFQYLAGPRNGEVVIFDKIEEEDGMVFVCFKDGSRCNEQLILPLNNHTYVNQLMAEVDSPTNLWQMKEEWVGRQEEIWAWLDETNPGLPEEKVCVQPFEPGKKRIVPIPPRKTTSKFGQINVFNTPDPATNISSAPDIKIEQQAPYKPMPGVSEDPVWLMCDKAKKFDTEINMTLTVSLPKKSLYDVAKESFEGGGEKVVEYIISNLDNKTIKESLRKALLEAYEEESSGIVPYVPETIVQPVIGGPQLAE